MVGIDIINTVLNDALTGIDVKCKPLKQVRSELSALSQDEKNSKLENLLNPGEKVWYDGIIDRLESAREWLEDAKSKGDTSMVSRYGSRVKMFEDLAFKFERRIIEGYDKETKNPPSVNISDFTEEEQTQFKSNNEIGELERKLINEQSETPFNTDSINALISYFGAGAGEINSMLNNGKRWNRYDKKEQEQHKKVNNELDRNLQSAFDTVNPLGQSVIVYHGGEFDVTKTVGDTVKFKGYTSASFQSNVGYAFSNFSTAPIELFYNYRILVPSTAKGICANNDSQGKLSNISTEQELLLNKGLEGDIVDIDYEHKMVTLKMK